MGTLVAGDIFPTTLHYSAIPILVLWPVVLLNYVQLYDNCFSDSQVIFSSADRPSVIIKLQTREEICKPKLSSYNLWRYLVLMLQWIYKMVIKDDIIFPQLNSPPNQTNAQLQIYCLKYVFKVQNNASISASMSNVLNQSISFCWQLITFLFFS